MHCANPPTAFADRKDCLFELPRAHTCGAVATLIRRERTKSKSCACHKMCPSPGPRHQVGSSALADQKTRWPPSAGTHPNQQNKSKQKNQPANVDMPGDWRNEPCNERRQDVSKTTKRRRDEEPNNLFRCDQIEHAAYQRLASVALRR